MVEAKKCVRCGCMYISENEVCGKCQEKDNADIYKLKGYLEDCDTVTKGELFEGTGILNKNLSRYLNSKEFKGVNIVTEEEKLAGLKTGKKVETDVELT